MQFLLFHFNLSDSYGCGVDFVLVLFLFQFWPGMMDELSELREFYDPDTVELMNWIK